MRRYKIFLTIFVVFLFLTLFVNTRASDKILEITVNGHTEEYSTANIDNLSYDIEFNKSSVSNPITIKLYSQLSANFSIESGNNVIFDLNGYTIEGESSSPVFEVAQNAKLKVVSDTNDATIKNKYNSDIITIYELVYNEGEFVSENITYKMSYDASATVLSPIIHNKNVMVLTNSNIINFQNYTAIVNENNIKLDNVTITDNKIGIENSGRLELANNTIIKANLDNNCILNTNSNIDFESDFTGEVKYLSNVKGSITTNYEEYMKGSLESEGAIDSYLYNGELYYYDEPFNVTFYNNLDSNLKVETTIAFGSTTFNDNINFSNPGYILQGYSTSSSGTIFVVDNYNKPFTDVNDYTDSNGGWIKTSNTALYAIWSGIGYTIVVHIDDEIVNKSVEINDVSLTNLTVEKQGYEFLGLYDSNDNQVCDSNLSFLSDTPYTNQGGFWTYNGSISLYSKYNANEYKVEVVDGPDTTDFYIDYDTDTLKSFTPFNKVGYNFKGLVDDDNNLIFDEEGKLKANISNISSASGKWISTSDIVLHPLYEAKEYKLSINDSSLEFLVKMGDDHVGEFLKPSKAHYTFKGFSYNGTRLIDSDGFFIGDDGVYLSEDKWIYDGDLSLDIIFEKTPVKVTIDYKNGDSIELDIYSGEKLDDLVSLPTKSGYIFTGIYDSDFDEYFDSDGKFVKTEITSNKNLFVVWGIEYDGTVYTICLNENSINRSGNYYLNDNINIVSGYIIDEGLNVKILMNGHTISTTNGAVFEVLEDSYLTIINGDSSAHGVIRNGKGKRVGNLTYGGAIYSNGYLSINDIDFIANQADDGIIYSLNSITINNVNIKENATENSIIYIEGNANRIDGLVLEDNSSSFGLYNKGTLSIENSTFKNNTNIKKSLIYNTGILTGDSLTFNNNTSSEAINGSLVNNLSDMTISNVIVDSNDYENTNGLIYNSGNLTIDTITIQTSKAKYGILNYDSLLRLNNATISLNNFNNFVGIKNSAAAQLIIKGALIDDNSGKAIENEGDLTLENKVEIYEEVYLKPNTLSINALDKESKIKISSYGEDDMLQLCEIPQSLSLYIKDIFTSVSDSYSVYIEDDKLYLLDISLGKIYNISFNNTLDGYEISGFTTSYLSENTEFNINIPTYYNDGTNGKKDIVKISDNAFKNKNLVGVVRLPENLKEIGDYAFYNTNIDTVYLPAINGNVSFINDTIFDSDVILIALNGSDYAFLNGKITNKFLTYVIEVTLDSNGGDTPNYKVNKLYNLDYHYVMKTNGSWYINDGYELPESSFSKHLFVGYNTESSGGGNQISKVVQSKYYAIYDRIMIGLVITVKGNDSLLVSDTLTSSKWATLVEVKIEYLDGMGDVAITDYSITGNISAGLNTFEFKLNSNESIKGYLDLQVVDPSITKIEIKNDPIVLVYDAFEEFDLSGLVLNVYRGDDITEATNVSIEYQDGNCIKNQGDGKDIVTIVYSDKTIEIEVIVNKIEYVLPDNIFVDKEYVYNGKEQKIEVIASNLPSDLKVIEYQKNTLTYVGSQEAIVYLKALDELNYLPIPALKATITIVPKELELKWIADYEFVYDQTEKIIRVEALNLEEHDENGVKVKDVCEISIMLSSGANNVNAGTFTYTAYEISNPNYKLPDNTLSDEFEIKKHRAVASWSKTYTIYNGQIQKPVVEIGDIYSGDSCEAIYDGYKNVGVYNVKITLSNPNYYVVLDKMDFEIAKASYADLHLSFNNLTITYDGLEHEAVIKGNIPDDLVINYSNNKLTDVGEITATASFIINDNYNPFEDVSCTLTIVKRYVEKPSESTVTYTYNGSEIQYLINESEYYTIENNVQTNAGTYTVTLKLNSPSNACWIGDEISDLEYDFTILKAKYNLDIEFNSASFEYDGKSHSIEIEGELPEGVTVRYENNSRIEIGTNEAKAIFTNTDSNYEDIPPLVAVLAVFEPGSMDEFTSSDGVVKIIFNSPNDKYYIFMSNSLSDDLLNQFKKEYTVKKSFDLYLQNGDEIVREGDFKVEILLYENFADYKFVEVLSSGEYKDVEYEILDDKLIFSTSKLGQYAIIKKNPKSTNVAAIVIPIVSALVVGLGVTFSVIFFKKTKKKSHKK